MKNGWYVGISDKLPQMEKSCLHYRHCRLMKKKNDMTKLTKLTK